MRHLRPLRWLSPLLAGLLFTGCETVTTFLPVAAGPSPSPTPIDLGHTNLVLQTYKPALAVRGMECLVCHARINSSIITDFGYGDSASFLIQKAGQIYGQSSVRSDDSPLTLPWYGNYYGTWQLAEEINGTIVVPKAMIADPRLLNSIGKSAPISLAELLDFDTGSAFSLPEFMALVNTDHPPIDLRDERLSIIHQLDDSKLQASASLP